MTGEEYYDSEVITGESVTLGFLLLFNLVVVWVFRGELWRALLRKLRFVRRAEQANEASTAYRPVNKETDDEVLTTNTDVTDKAGSMEEKDEEEKCEEEKNEEEKDEVIRIVGEKEKKATKAESTNQIQADVHRIQEVDESNDEEEPKGWVNFFPYLKIFLLKKLNLWLRQKRTRIRRSRRFCSS